MVDCEGALPTAKRLIMSRTPSSGFTRPWELKRPDLTVEALALREPWRRLFTEAELKKARQRLDQLNYKSELERAVGCRLVGRWPISSIRSDLRTLGSVEKEFI